ncbi:unnamed protein product [Echinostoma caproni]|uniref:C2H2-type domain-containing protein n=1 Tax=Echinostoma caproni TaxID=27848 RepID=A0A3P8LBR8_9TREM|nr:unnamed protein product [Echinostoma caproni]
MLSECPSGTADWDRLVLAPAVRVVHNHLTRSGTGLAVHDLQYERLNTLLALCSADQVPQPCPFISETDPTVDEDLGDGPPFICTACCNRMFSRLEDWRAHRKSRSHQKRMNKLRKQALIQSVICDDADE